MPTMMQLLFISLEIEYLYYKVDLGLSHPHKISQKLVCKVSFALIYTL